MCSSNNRFHGVPCDGSQLHQNNNNNNNNQQHHAGGDLADMIRAIRGAADTGGGSSCGGPNYSLDLTTTSSSSATLFTDHLRAADHQEAAEDQSFVPLSFHGQHKIKDDDDDHDVGFFFNSNCDPFSSIVIRDPLFQHSDDDQQDMMMMMMNERNISNDLYCSANDSAGSNNMKMLMRIKSKQSNNKMSSADNWLLGHDQHELRQVSCYSQQMKQQPPEKEEEATAFAAAGITYYNGFSEMLHISQNLITTRPPSPPISKPAPITTTPQKEVPSGGSWRDPDTFNNLSVNTGGCPSGTMQLSSPRVPAAIKRRKSLAKKVVCIPAPAPANSRPGGEVVPSDLWAWRKYGQKPIKGSPYPRGYYRCSSSKGCSARKQVERSRTDPNMLVITYTSEHNHPWPTQRNALAGSTRSQASSKNRNNSKVATPGGPNTYGTGSLFELRRCALSIDEETEECSGGDQLMKHKNNGEQTMATIFGFRMSSLTSIKNSYIIDEKSAAGGYRNDQVEDDPYQLMDENDSFYNEQVVSYCF